MALIQVRVNDSLKKVAQKTFDDIGLDLSTAIRMFLIKAIEVNGMPFDVVSNEKDIKYLIATKHMQLISEENGNSNMTLDDINEEIRLAREERRLREEGKKDK